MKTCKGCSQELPTSAFPKSAYRRKSDGLQGLRSLCRKCLAKEQTPYFKEYYGKRSKHYHEMARQRKLKKQEWFIEYRKTQKCADCGTTDWRVLQFDHNDPSEKIAGVAQMLTFSQEKLLAEIAKCTVRCANCHHIRTALQKDFYKDLGAYQLETS